AMRIHDLLIWQGQRTLEDHWFAADPGGDPYYSVAGLLFTDDARRFDPRQKAPHPTLQTLQQQLTRPGELVLKGLARRDITSDQPFVLDYDLQAAPDAYVPSGYPVIWVETANASNRSSPQAVAPVQVLSPSPDSRLVRPFGILPEGPTSERVTCQLVSPLLARAEVEPPLVP